MRYTTFSTSEHFRILSHHCKLDFHSFLKYFFLIVVPQVCVLYAVLLRSLSKVSPSHRPIPLSVRSKEGQSLCLLAQCHRFRACIMFELGPMPRYEQTSWVPVSQRSGLAPPVRTSQSDPQSNLCCEAFPSSAPPAESRQRLIYLASKPFC